MGMFFSVSFCPCLTRFAQGEAANIEQICDEMMGQRVGSLSLRFACVVMKGAQLKARGSDSVPSPDQVHVWHQ